MYVYNIEYKTFIGIEKRKGNKIHYIKCFGSKKYGTRITELNVWSLSNVYISVDPVNVMLYIIMGIS